MYTINRDIDRPDETVVSGFDGIPSAIVSDVVETPGATMDSGIRPVDREATVAGAALTVKAVPGDNLIIHKALTMAVPGDVLIIDGGSHTETAFAGELMCLSCREHGLSVLVIDGAVRDRTEIAALEFPVYTRGTHPKGPSKRHLGSINVPLSCGGTVVRPGDVVVGDGDGVAVVPKESAEETLERATETLEAEAALRDRVRKGEYLYEISGYDEVFERLSERDTDCLDD